MNNTGNSGNNAIVLQHEAYRDGATGGNQYRETVNAAVAHTAMAARMRDEGELFSMTGNLAADLTVWDMAQATGNMGLMAAYAGAAYDSSADYWKVIKKDDGTWGWEDDKSADFDISEILEKAALKVDLIHLL
jgi:hypothetical protein